MKQEEAHDCGSWRVHRYRLLTRFYQSLRGWLVINEGYAAGEQIAGKSWRGGENGDWADIVNDFTACVVGVKNAGPWVGVDVDVCRARVRAQEDIMSALELVSPASDHVALTNPATTTLQTNAWLPST